MADNAVRPEPWAAEEDKVVTDANYLLKDLIEGSLSTTLEDITDEVTSGSLTTLAKEGDMATTNC